MHSHEQPSLEIGHNLLLEKAINEANRIGDDSSKACLSPCNSSSPLFDAVMEGDAAALKVLIAAKADLEQQKRVLGYSPFFLAASFDDAALPKMTRIFIEAKCDVNIRSTTQENVFHEMARLARGSNNSAFKMLVAAKADVNAKDCQSKTPLCVALKSDNKDIASLLIEAKADIFDASVQALAQEDASKVAMLKSLLAKKQGLVFLCGTRCSKNLVARAEARPLFEPFLFRLLMERVGIQVKRNKRDRDDEDNDKDAADSCAPKPSARS